MAYESNGMSEKLEQEHKRYLEMRKKVSDILGEFGDAVHNCDASPAIEVNLHNFHQHYIDEIMKIINS